MTSTLVPLKNRVTILWLIVVAFLIALIGVALVAHANTLPIYTDPEALGRVSQELAELDREDRFDQWYIQLATYETRHKTLADLGRGLIAGGVGFITAIGLISVYNQFVWFRTLPMLLFAWVALWLVRIPLSFWYYQYRQQRGDYPSWGDTIIIPIFSELISWILGAVFSSVILLFLLSNHTLPTRLFHYPRPNSFWGWARTAIISLWLMLNLLCIYEGIQHGDEGMTFSCLVATAILAIILAATPVSQSVSASEITIDSLQAQPEP